MRLTLLFVTLSTILGFSLSVNAIDIICMIYSAADGQKETLSSDSKGTSELTLGNYKFALQISDGDGGEPGYRQLTIERDGKMIHKTLWQGNEMSQKGQRTGLNYLLQAPLAGGAEIQYRCEVN